MSKNSIFSMVVWAMLPIGNMSVKASSSSKMSETYSSSSHQSSSESYMDEKGNRVEVKDTVKVLNGISARQKKTTVWKKDGTRIVVKYSEDEKGSKSIVMKHYFPDGSRKVQETRVKTDGTRIVYETNTGADGTKTLTESSHKPCEEKQLQDAPKEQKVLAVQGSCSDSIDNNNTGIKGRLTALLSRVVKIIQSIQNNPEETPNNTVEVQPAETPNNTVEVQPAETPNNTVKIDAIETEPVENQVGDKKEVDTQKLISMLRHAYNTMN